VEQICGIFKTSKPAWAAQIGMGFGGSSGILAPEMILK